MRNDLRHRTEQGGKDNAARRRVRPVRPALLAGEEREAPERHIFRGTD
ncbi:hypothetical protein ACWDYJ_28300 [Streptomyces sp. NPDC003042]